MGSAENIGAMFITIVVFIGVASGLVLWMENDIAPEGALPPETNINGISYTGFTPTRPVTWANATDDYVGLENSYAMHIWETDNNDPFHVVTVRNNTHLDDYTGWFGTPSQWCLYSNYIGIEQHGWPWTDRFSISYGAITEMHNTTYVTSDTVVIAITDFDKAAYVLVIEASSAANFYTDLFVNNDFNITIGLRTDVGAPADEVSWWDMAWNFLTGVYNLLFGNSIPSVPYISWAISIALWAAIIFLVYEFVTRSYGGG